MKNHKPLNIAIDATALSIPYHCGTKTYATSLIKALQSIDRHNHYVLILTEQKAAKIITNPNFSAIVLSKIVGTNRLIGRIKSNKIAHFDLIHKLDPYGILSVNHPNILTSIHDMGSEKVYNPISLSWHKHLFLNMCLHTTLRHSSAFVTGTDTIKKELVSSLKTMKRNTKYHIKTIPYGSDHIARPIVKRINKKQLSFLIFWDYPIRKNVRFVLKTISMYLKHSPVPINIQVVVNTKENNKKAQSWINRLNADQHIKVFLSPSMKELATLYAGSHGLLYLSLYEGFGLPIVEAMRCGCPVIATNYGAMKEVAGGAALLINPQSQPAIISAIQQLATNIKQREILIKKGIKKANEFKWQETAEQILRVYKSMT